MRAFGSVSHAQVCQSDACEMGDAEVQTLQGSQNTRQPFSTKAGPGEDEPVRSLAYRLPAVKEKHSAGGREGPRADRPIGHMARDHNAGEQSEPHTARMGELLP